MNTWHFTWRCSWLALRRKDYSMTENMPTIVELVENVSITGMTNLLVARRRQRAWVCEHNRLERLCPCSSTKRSYWTPPQSPGGAQWKGFQMFVHPPRWQRWGRPGAWGRWRRRGTRAASSRSRWSCHPLKPTWFWIRITVAHNQIVDKTILQGRMQDQAGWLRGWRRLHSRDRRKPQICTAPHPWHIIGESPLISMKEVTSRGCRRWPWQQPGWWRARRSPWQSSPYPGVPQPHAHSQAFSWRHLKYYFKIHEFLLFWGVWGDWVLRRCLSQLWP